MMKRVRGFLAMAAALAFLAQGAWSQQAGLAATPPMGWNSWNHFAEQAWTDADIRATAADHARQ